MYKAESHDVYTYSYDSAGQLHYSQDDYEYTQLIKGRDQSLNTNTQWIIQTDLVSTVSWDTRLIYP